MSLPVPRRDRIIAAVLVVLVTAGVIGLVRANEREAHERVHQLVLESTHVMNTVTRAWLDEWTHWQRTVAAERFRDDRVERDALLRVSTGTPVAGVTIADAKGRLIAGTSLAEGMRPGSMLDELPHIAAALDNQVGFAGPDDLPSLSAPSMVAIAVPYVADNNRRIVSVTLDLAQTSLTAQLDALADQLSMTVAVVDEAGRLMTARTATEGHGGVAAVLGEGTPLPRPGEVIHVRRSGAPALAAALPVGASPWHTIVTIRESDAIGFTGGAANWRGRVGAALAVLAAASAAFLWVRGRDRSRSAVAAAATAEARASEWEVLFVYGATPKLVLDRTGRIERANRAAERLLGLENDELAGMAALDLLIADHHEKGIVNEVMEVLTGRHGAAICRFVADKGRERYGMLSGAPIVGDDGEIRRIVLQIVDLTEQREAHDQLERSRAKLEALLDNSPVATCIFTPHGVEVVNKALCDLTGRSAGELYRLHPMETLVHPDDRDRVNAAVGELRRAFHGGVEDARGELAIEHRLVTAGGRVVEVQSSAVVIDGTDDEPGHLIVQLHDVTDLRQAERAMARSRDALAAFSTVVAHDLKTPLTSMVGFLDLVLSQGQEMDDATKQRILQKVADSAQRASDQINQVLDEARRLSGSVRIPVQIEDLHGWLQQFLGPKLIETGASLELASTVDQAELPEDTVKQVLLNLVTNSLKYQRPGVPPRVVLSVTRDQGHVIFAVEDDGRGIAADDVETIFDRGRQLHTDVEGHGLGLHLCRQLVEAEGGTIGASPREPHGLRVEFTIPIQGSTATAAERRNPVTARR